MLRPQLGPLPLVIALAPWVARWAVSGRPGYHSPFDWPLLVFLLTAGVSVWAAYDRQSALAKFWLIVGAVLLYYSFANWATGSGSRVLEKQAWLLALTGAMIAIYFLLTHDWEAYPNKIGMLSRLGRDFRSLLPALPVEQFHPNVMAGGMAMMLPFAAAIATLSWRGKRNRELGASLGLLFIILIALMLSGSRGAWAAVTLTAIIIAGWQVIRYLVKDGRRRRSWLFGSVIVALIVVSVLLVAAPGLIETTITNLPSIESGIKRADLYRNSLILVEDYPLIGAGLDSFMMLYSTYALLLHVGFSPHGHNLALDLTIEQGILAVFALLWMLLLMSEAVWRMMEGKRKRRSSSPAPAGSSRSHRSDHAVLLGAAAASISIFLIHGIVDDAVYATRMALLMFVPFAFAVPTLLRARMPSRKQQLQAVFLGLAILFLVFLFSWRPILSLFRSNMAAVRQSQAELSVYEWPTWPVQDAVRQVVDLDDSIAGYEEALSLNPGNASARRRLGQILLSLGKYEQAIEHLEVAYSATAWDNATKQLLGEAYLAVGRVEDGTALWSRIDNEQGQLNLRSSWYRHLDAMAQFDAIRAATKMVE